jgi:hypothetical protein
VRHLRVAALVHADRVAMGEADDLGDPIGIDQILCVDSRRHDT